MLQPNPQPELELVKAVLAGDPIAVVRRDHIGHALVRHRAARGRWAGWRGCLPGHHRGAQGQRLCPAEGVRRTQPPLDLSCDRGARYSCRSPDARFCRSKSQKLETFRAAPPRRAAFFRATPAPDAATTSIGRSASNSSRTNIGASAPMTGSAALPGSSSRSPIGS